MPSVDIIILSWDRTRDTIEAIRSACGQQGIDVRVLVVDQGSRPEGLDQLRSFLSGLAQVHLQVNRRNTGVAGGRNQASAMGCADYIVALDNDAVFADPTVCARAAACMEADPGIGAMGFAVNLFDSPHGQPVPDVSSWCYGELDPRIWASKIFPARQFCGAGHIIRRSAFEQVGRYDERLFFMHEEVDLCDRLINAGYRIEYRGDIAVRHKVAAEHRFHWQSSRYRFHLRNHIYLMMKQGRPGFEVFSELLVMLVAGWRAGLAGGALAGVLGVLGLWPAARREAAANPYLKRSEAGRAHLEKVAETLPPPRPAPPWQDAPALWQLICRLRWETLFARQLAAPASGHHPRQA